MYRIELTARLLPLLWIAACQAAPVSAPVTPAPSAALPTPAQPQPPTPVSSPGSEGDSCQPDSANLRLGVYSNPEDIDYDASGAPLDKRQPIPFAEIEVGDQHVMADARGRAEFPRPPLTPVQLRPEDPPNAMLTIQIQAVGFHPHSQTFYNRVCGQLYAALSPLSPAEKSAQEMSLDKINLTGDVTQLKQDPTSGLYYGLIHTPAQLEALQLKALYAAEGTDALTPLAQALKAGKAVALLSDGSLGQGTPYDLIQRLSLKDGTAIMAGHLGTILPDPVPVRPIGDRFSVLIEAVILPGDTQELLYQVLPFQAATGQKREARISASQAEL